MKVTREQKLTNPINRGTAEHDKQRDNTSMLQEYFHLFMRENAFRLLRRKISLSGISKNNDRKKEKYLIVVNKNPQHLRVPYYL
jgi:hypothetical protein